MKLSRSLGIAWACMGICLFCAYQSDAWGQIVLKKRGDLAAKVEDYLNAKKWTFSENESDDIDKTIFWLSFKGENTSFKSYYTTDEKMRWFRLLSVTDFKVPAGKRNLAAEYLTRVNDVRSLGCFDMDYDDGTVLYRIGVDTEGGELVEKMIDNITIDSQIAMEKFIPGLLKVIYGELPPEEVLKEVLTKQP